MAGQQWRGATAERFREEHAHLSGIADRLSSAVERIGRGAQSVIDRIDSEDAAGAAAASGFESTLPTAPETSAKSSSEPLPLAPLPGMGPSGLGGKSFSPAAYVQRGGVPMAPYAEPTVHPPADGAPLSKFGKPLTVKTIGKRLVYIDANGVPHPLANSPDNAASQAALDFMNKKLEREGTAYNSVTQSGSQYLLQDDTDPLVPKGLINGKVTGTTADMMKVTWERGRIVSVETVDATTTTGDNLDSIATTINNKLPSGRKCQTENVVFVANSEEQAEKVAAKFATNPNVRVIHPESGFDSGEFGNAPTAQPFGPPSRDQAAARARAQAELAAEFEAAMEAEERSGGLPGAEAGAEAEAEAEAFALAEAEAMAAEE
ncbi:hypothetical protein ACFYZJ_10775 [Streptomyces sp. NPDC001848]|uniref:hypothetical protein n=1 Tax=Streptomyces sp. NPDC001848 TaxID=3364618 RepID=UPI00367639E7